jgi:hypothetical protein
MNKEHALAALVFVSFALGCAPRAAAPAAAPAPPVAAAEPAAPAPKPAPVEPAAVPPPPAECAAHVQRATTGCAPATPLVDALALALAEPDVARRDTALACLEAAGPPGLMRALRAELGPEVCADALSLPLLEKPPAGLSPEIEQLLFGLTVSARLERLLGDPPALAPPVTKDSFQTYFKERLTPWILSQALAVGQLSLEGSRLSGYGRAVAALAAGNADLRFVELVRELPIPDEMKNDKELSDVYYAALDEALEPRKARGRDAALVGLRSFAALGALHDPRLVRARLLLSKLYSGARVDALDRLMLPEVPAPDDASSVARVASKLPTFYANVLLKDADPNDARVLRALLARGLPPVLREKLEKQKLAEPARLLLARIEIDLGRTYFRAQEFRAASELLPAGGGADQRLYRAVAKALAAGPSEIAELMLKGPMLKGTIDVSALDAEVKARSAHAAMAAFDAAYLVQLAPEPTAEFWNGVAARFEAAAKLFEANAKRQKGAGDHATMAAKYAEAARATAASLVPAQ